MRGRRCRAGTHTRAVEGDLLVRARHLQAGVERAAARPVQRDALDVLERERRRLLRGDVHAVEAETLDRTSPVLLGIDGSPASQAATALAFDEASRRQVDLVALHAWSDVGVFPMLGMDWHEYEDEGQEVLGERLAGWQEQYPDVHVRRRIVCDTPARWLIDESQRAQLVVVGSHGRGGFPGMLLGSVSSALAQSAISPVIVVRNPAPERIAQN